MTNSTRTALLNLAPWTGPDLPVAEEYVPSGYVPRRLTGALAYTSGLLFGAGADRAGRNITLARFLACAHASPFAADVTVDDARITYDVTTGVTFNRIGPTVSGDPAVGWDGSATFPAPGRGSGTWYVTTDGVGGYTTVSAGDNQLSGSVTVGPLGDTVPLVGSNLGLVVPTDANGSWTVNLIAPPSDTFTELAEAVDVASLFRPSGSDRDRRWYDAWSGTGPVWFRAVALGLALSVRTIEQGA